AATSLHDLRGQRPVLLGARNQHKRELQQRCRKMPSIRYGWRSYIGPLLSSAQVHLSSENNAAARVFPSMIGLIVVGRCMRSRMPGFNTTATGYILVLLSVGGNSTERHADVPGRGSGNDAQGARRFRRPKALKAPFPA